MHELSLAYNLVEIASEAARRAGVQRVTAVNLRLGALAGVVKEALLFGYEVATQGTPLEGSRLVIEDVPVVVKCERCENGCELPSVQSFRCPRYDIPAPTVVHGKELEIQSLEYDDDPAYPGNS
jgi:hydrogenase nickel incorporation protein HypA/HybF